MRHWERNGVNGGEGVGSEGKRSPWYQSLKGKRIWSNWPGGFFGFFLAKEKQAKPNKNKTGASQRAASSHLETGVQKLRGLQQMQ